MAPDSAFNPAHSRQSFFETPNVGAALRRLDDGLGAREPFLLVTGDPGTGKSALADEAVARWGSRVTAAYLAYPALTSAEFLEEVIRRFGAEPPDAVSRSKLVACVELALAEVTRRGQVAMLVVDDAHDLSAELLEQLRLLVNTAKHAGTSLEVMLIGLPTLEERLDQPEFVSLRQRVSVHAKLEPLSFTETRSYIHHRISALGGDGPSPFTRRICRDIAARTRGIPRQINALAAEALRMARASGNQSVGAEHVEAGAAALWGLAPPGDLEDSDVVGSTEPPSPMAPPAPVPADAAAHAPQAQPLPKAEAAVPASARPAPTEIPATPEGPHTGPIEATVEARYSPPTHPDPREWVARFVGDKGPVKISSRAIADSHGVAEASEASGEPARPRETPDAPRRSPGSARHRSPSGHRVDVRMAGSALLVTIVVVAAVGLLIRAGGRAQGPAEQVGGVATTARAPHDDPALSVGGPGSGSPEGDESHTARVREAGSNPRSNRPYTLDVGGSLDFERALEQRDRLQALTGIEGWVAPAADPDGKGYRIVLGVYRSRERAESAASMLLRSKTLKGVTVVPLPPQSVRR